MPDTPPNAVQTPIVFNENVDCVNCHHEVNRATAHEFYLAEYAIGPVDFYGIRPTGLSPYFCCDKDWCNECNQPVGRRGYRYPAQSEFDDGHAYRNYEFIEIRCKHFWCRSHGSNSHYGTCNTCGFCEGTCECYECNACLTRRSANENSICDNCEYGSCCCECYHCRACDTTFSNTSQAGYCDNCDKCQDCCDCVPRHSGVRLGDGHAEPVFHNSKRNKGRFIAAEIEVASSNADKCDVVNEALQRWGAIAVPDGSLPDGGYEINTAPAKDEKFDQEIEDICGALKKANARANRSCGLHVHIDCRDLQYFDLKKVLQTYWEIEEDLFAMISPSRRSSQYCGKLKHSDQAWSNVLNKKLGNKEWRATVTQKIYQFKHNPAVKKAQNQFRTNKYNQARYYALNLHSWFYRKTIEFRHHQGTVNAQKIINWARICEKLIDFAMRHSEKEIKQHFSAVDGIEPLASILPEHLKTYVLERKEYFKNNRFE